MNRQRVEQFAQDAERFSGELGDELRSGRYRPQPVRRYWIPKPGTNQQRCLGIPTVRDRIAQTGLRNALEPSWEERRFPEQSCGFRPGRGCQDALRRVQALLDAGYTWVVDADIQSYFDTIDHTLLRGEIEKEAADGRELELIDAFLQQGVVEDLHTWEPETGTPQGAVISPLLANIFLQSIDEALVEAGYELVRHADDRVILCRTEAEARVALDLLGHQVEQRRLRLHPEKTRVVDATKVGGFDFLGYHFERGHRWPRKKNFESFKDRVRGHTRRTNGESLASIITDLNRFLRRWFAYFKHNHRFTFIRLDG